MEPKRIIQIIIAVLLVSLTLIVLALPSIISNSDVEVTHRLQWWLSAINWDVESRGNGLTGKEVQIAVIDTAIDAAHPDLEGKITEQFIVDGVAEDLRYEHGTAIAGIICASPKTSEGVLGIATNAKILSIVISNNTEAQVDNLIQGIEYAVSRNVDIINISAGVVNDDPRLQHAINNAYDAGIIIVAASGNDLFGTTLYPARYDNVISVDSVDAKGTRLYGEKNGSVLLPGGNIVTTYSSQDEQKKYVSYSGTSMSCAMLSGIIALLLEQNPTLRNTDILSFFSDFTATNFDTLEILGVFDTHNS